MEHYEEVLPEKLRMAIRLTRAMVIEMLVDEQMKELGLNEKKNEGVGNMAKSSSFGKRYIYNLSDINKKTNQSIEIKSSHIYTLFL